MSLDFIGPKRGAMIIFKPFLWYRHIARGVYYDTAISMRNRKTGVPDTVTAILYTSFAYSGLHVAVAYFFCLITFGFSEIHDYLTGIVFFGTHKGPFNLLVLLGVLTGWLIAWLCCRYCITFSEIAEEFNYKKPGLFFVFLATFSVPALGFAAGMYAVSQEHERYGLNEIPYIEVRQEVVGASLVVARNPRN